MSVNRCIAVGHQCGGSGGSLFQGPDPEESISEINGNIGFGAIAFTHPQELVVTESVGDRNAEFPVWPADRANCSCPTGEIVDHLGPVEKIDIRSPRKADYRNPHASDESGSLGLEVVGSRNNSGLGPDLSVKGRSFHKLPEQAWINGVKHPVLYPDGERGSMPESLQETP